MSHLTLTGQGLVLRPLDLVRDLEPMHAIFSDPDSVRFLARPTTATPAETAALLEAWQTAPQWAITRDGGLALGRITLVPQRTGVAEVGVHVVPSGRGQRLAARAAVVLTAHGLGQGLVRVAADIDPGNIASVKTFERAGFRYEGHLRHNWLTHTGPADSLIYAATEGWVAPELRPDGGS